MLKLAGNQIGGNLNYSTTHVRSCSRIAPSSVEQVKINIARGESDSATNNRVMAQTDSDTNGRN